MTSIMPGAKPQLLKEDLLAHIELAHPDFIMPELFVVGIRGYYEDSMGVPGKNDRNLYDDALFIVGKNIFAAFNGNTDPGAYKKGIAVLKPGVWQVYKLGLHKESYLALCQRAGNVIVIRDGIGDDKGSFGINIHKGGNTVTGSLGCQTLPPEQWGEFINTFTTEAKKLYGKAYQDKVYTYVLLNQ